MNMIEHVGQVLSMLASAMSTYGRWPSPGRTEFEQRAAAERMRDIATVYADALTGVENVTPEVLQLAYRRIMEGRARVRKGESWDALSEFPTAPEFRQIVEAAANSIYCQVAIERPDGSVHLLTVRRDASSEQIEALKSEKRLELGLPIKPIPQPSELPGSATPRGIEFKIPEMKAIR